jgi:hypothetical protein
VRESSIKSFIYQPSQASSVEASGKDLLEYRAVAIVDLPGPAKKAMAAFSVRRESLIPDRCLLRRNSHCPPQREGCCWGAKWWSVETYLFWGEISRTLQSANAQIGGKLFDRRSLHWGPPSSLGQCRDYVVILILCTLMAPFGESTPAKPSSLFLSAGRIIVP